MFRPHNPRRDGSVMVVTVSPPTDTTRTKVPLRDGLGVPRGFIGNFRSTFSIRRYRGRLNRDIPTTIPNVVHGRSHHWTRLGPGRTHRLLVTWPYTPRFWTPSGPVVRDSRVPLGENFSAKVVPGPEDPETPTPSVFPESLRKSQ